MIKELIKIIKENQSKQDSIIKEIKNISHDEEKLVNKITTIPNSYFISTEITQIVCNALSLLDEEKNFSQFSLFDLKDIYQKNVELQPNNLDYLEDYIFFLDSVLDENTQATALALKAIEIAKEKVSIFEKILTNNKSL